MDQRIDLSEDEIAGIEVEFGGHEAPDGFRLTILCDQAHMRALGLRLDLLLSYDAAARIFNEMKPYFTKANGEPDAG